MKLPCGVIISIPISVCVWDSPQECNCGVWCTVRKRFVCEKHCGSCNQEV